MHTPMQEPELDLIVNPTYLIIWISTDPINPVQVVLVQLTTVYKITDFIFISSSKKRDALHGTVDCKSYVVRDLIPAMT